MINRQFRLASRPVGLPQYGNWEYREEPPREPDDGEVLVRLQYLSLDPAMRGWMNAGRSYIEPVELGEVMRAGAAGRVLTSRDARFVPGDTVTGMLGVQDYATVPGNRLTRADTRQAPLPVWLSALGMSGLTAYFGLLDVGRPQAGQTVLVSGAAGAVGGVVGQIARIRGARAIGIAGGPDKCRYLVEQLGFDDAIDYRRDDVKQRLRRAAPDGIDIYFDNVGGNLLETVLSQLALRARIVLCGAISQYNATAPGSGPANYMALLVKRARMEGFVVFDYQDRYDAARAELAGWLRSGDLRSTEDIADGLETFPDTLLRLFRGDNLGKQLLRLHTED